MLKRDSLPLGLVLGFIAPIFGMLIYYFVKFFPTFSLADFFRVMGTQKSLITGIVSISLIANAVIFTVYINTRKDKTAKGIFTATCIYAIVAMIVKFFL
jgi:hypothetical protein